MANTPDEQNKGKIEASIDNLISQSKDELEKEAAILSQRQMGSAKREMSKDIKDDMTDNIYQDNKKKNVRDRSIRQINPE